MSNEKSGHDHQSQVLEQTDALFDEPNMYKVLLLNDDYTPMDFVIRVLQKFFNMDEQKATQIMLHVHTRGKGLCGIFSHEVAETKVAQVNQFSRDHQHPLLCVFEMV